MEFIVKKTIKTLLLMLTCTALAALLALGVFSSGAGDDPQDSYVKQNAQYEDSDIDLWFEHSFKKIYTSDTVSSGMDTYSVYMAKNEVENIQFVLYSDVTKAGMSAYVTSFTDGKGTPL